MKIRNSSEYNQTLDRIEDLWSRGGGGVHPEFFKLTNAAARFERVRSMQAQYREAVLAVTVAEHERRNLNTN